MRQAGELTIAQPGVHFRMAWYQQWRQSGGIPPVLIVGITIARGSELLVWRQYCEYIRAETLRTLQEV